MLNHACVRASRLLGVSFVACACLFWQCETKAQFGLPSAVEPWLAESGDRYADFNLAQIACYRGSMSACDAIWLSDRVLLDTLLSRYGRTCGGRVDYRAISRAGLACTEAFPGYE